MPANSDWIEAIWGFLLLGTGRALRKSRQMGSEYQAAVKADSFESLSADERGTRPMDDPQRRLVEVGQQLAGYNGAVVCRHALALPRGELTRHAEAKELVILQQQPL